MVQILLSNCNFASPRTMLYTPKKIREIVWYGGYDGVQWHLARLPFGRVYSSDVLPEDALHQSFVQSPFYKGFHELKGALVFPSAIESLPRLLKVQGLKKLPIVLMPSVEGGEMRRVGLFGEEVVQFAPELYSFWKIPIEADELKRAERLWEKFNLFGVFACYDTTHSELNMLDYLKLAELVTEVHVRMAADFGFKTEDLLSLIGIGDFDHPFRQRLRTIRQKCPNIKRVVVEIHVEAFGQSWITTKLLAQLYRDICRNLKEDFS